MAGEIGWVDLTVDDAEGVRDFYAAVVGWRAQGLDMGGYEDFNMCDAAGAPVAGVCHARGGNAHLPPVWLVYFVVDDLAAALEQATSGGGEILGGPRDAGGSRYAVLRDPAGAAFALFEKAPSGAGAA